MLFRQTTLSAILVLFKTQRHVKTHHDVHSIVYLVDSSDCKYCDCFADGTGRPPILHLRKYPLTGLVYLSDVDWVVLLRFVVRQNFFLDRNF